MSRRIDACTLVHCMFKLIKLNASIKTEQDGMGKFEKCKVFATFCDYSLTIVPIPTRHEEKRDESNWKFK